LKGKVDMSSNENEHDPLETLLGDRSLGHDESLRSDILGQTSVVLRWRRNVRRVKFVAALVVCFLAGAISMRLWQSPIEKDSPMVAEEIEKNVPQEPSAPVQIAVATTKKRTPRQVGFEEIRGVSDRYLQEQGDLPTALQYYSRALDQASTDEMSVSVDEDSWLLMALKSARMKEKQNEDG